MREFDDVMTPALDPDDRSAVAQAALRLILASVYAGVGSVHLLSPDSMLAIVPEWVPRPRDVILLTGACEIAGAAGLLLPRFRRLAGIMLALYAACVLPANVKHALEGIEVGGLPTSWWYHGPRLAFQPVLIWAALWAGEVIRWPFGRRSPSSATPGSVSRSRR